jgi:hypothetical protein
MEVVVETFAPHKVSEVRKHPLGRWNSLKPRGDGTADKLIAGLAPMVSATSSKSVG